MQCRLDEFPKFPQDIRNAERDTDNDSRIDRKCKWARHFGIEQVYFDIFCYAESIGADGGNQSMQPLAEIAHHPVGEKVLVRGRHHDTVEYLRIISKGEN